MDAYTMKATIGKGEEEIIHQMSSIMIYDYGNPNFYCINPKL